LESDAIPPSLSTDLFALFGTDDIKFEEKHFPSTKILVAKSLSGKCAQPHIAKYSFAWTFSQYNGEPATFSLIEN